jgi:glycosyltransferase involved in cell wall biosynthesis
VVTCRDPRGWRDHLVELRHTNLQRRLLFPLTYLYEASPWVKQAVRRADAVLTPAPTELHPRIARLYGADVEPEFVPYPVDLPGTAPRKAERPLILFVGRFDRRKRLELFFDLAVQFPQLDFAAVGRAHDPAYDRHLRERYGAIANLDLPGFVPRFGQPGILDYYERAWILVNTAAREGLPYTFMEAAAFGVAILSGVDPERFASRFGCHAQDGDFAAALRWLLEGDRWRALGQSAAAYVAETWSEEASVRRHLEVYRRLGCPVPASDPGPSS